MNAVKHAAPTGISVLVDRVDGQLVLEINDDGTGIDTEQAGRAVQAGHVGLAMVRRRVENAGGTLEIATERTQDAIPRDALENGKAPDSMPEAFPWTHVLLRPGRSRLNLQSVHGSERLLKRRPPLKEGKAGHDGFQELVAIRAYPETV